MATFTALEPAIDPNNRITFLLDWELTLKCNLDCSYCSQGHDNSTKHPPKDDCIKALDFMLEYVDLYMSTKPRSIKHVILNVYGGESLYHPDIVDILGVIREKHSAYSSKWSLTITTTTNAIIPEKKLQQILPYIDEFTVSYHTENTAKQKQQFKDNLLVIAQSGKKQKCVVLMHQQSELFHDASDMIKWLTQHNIRVLPRQLDGDAGVEGKRKYSHEKIVWFDNLYTSRSFGERKNILSETSEQHLTNVGRACCGGRQLCTDQDFGNRQFYIENKFPDWYCSVNHFFLYVKQVTGEIFVNKDCKMNFHGTVGPIGYLNDTSSVLKDLKTQLDTHSLPIIQCKKSKCFCGLCAPKAKNLLEFNDIMKKYHIKQ
jgi:pyruvate-formate lyase-activating enzyme